MDWALEEKLENVNLAFELMEEAGLPKPVNRRVLKQQFFPGKRCRLYWLTNSALVYEPKCGGRGGVAESQPMSTAVHSSPNKLWRSTVTPYLSYNLYGFSQ
jgi:hypothetical protein